MHIRRRSLFLVGGLVAAALLAGCGATVGAVGGGTSTPAPTATSGSTMSNVVQTASVAVQGKQVTVLADSRGYTLYYFDKDTASASNCTGACSQTWPAVTASGTSVQAPSGVSGTLSTLSDGNGTQVTYNGHPLYTYSGDSAPAQSNGDGVEGLWHVASLTIPDISGNNSGGGAGGGGYGY